MATSIPGATTAVSSASFVDSVGVNIHLPYDWTTYGNLNLVEQSLGYLGIHNVRDSLVPWPQTQPDYKALMSLGYHFDFILPIASIDIPGYVALVDSYVTKNPGGVLAIEGPNEVNIWPVTYNGGSGPANAAQFQQALYSAVRADANLDDIPVYNLTLGTADANAFKQIGNLSSAADYGNIHPYLHDDRAPVLTEQILFPLANIDTPGKPAVITETGYTTDPKSSYNGISEAGQAKYTLDTLMDAYKAGFSHTFIYELLDERSDPQNTDPEMHYGLFHSDGTPKLAATAIHNLTTVLNDPGASSAFTPGSLSYTLSNFTAPFANQMLLEKSNGKFDLVLWAEPTIWNPTTQQDIASPHDLATVNFAQVESKVSVFDPLLGSTTIATYTNVSQVSVDITDHPLVIEITNGTQTTTTTTTTTTPTPPPAPPSIAGFSPDSSAVGDGVTNAQTLKLTGSAPANSTVTVFDGSNPLGTALANGSGAWAFTTGKLTDGPNSFKASDADAAGHVSALSQALSVTVDTSAPKAPVITSDTTLNTNAVSLTGTAEAGAKVNVFDGTVAVGTTTANASGAWSLTTNPLSIGSHAFTATATDAAGNTSPVSQIVDPIIGGTTIESHGSTSLTQLGNTYYLDDSLSLKSGGVDFAAGCAGGWTPIGAEQTASGFEVAWKVAGCDQYGLWMTDSNGNFISNPVGVVSGNSTTWTSLEAIFHQDLNGDGVIGGSALPPPPPPQPPTTPSTSVIESFGSTSLTQLGNTYYL